MNKNTLLGLLGLGAVVVVGALLFVDMQESPTLSTPSLSSSVSSNQNEPKSDVAIVHKKKDVPKSKKAKKEPPKEIHIAALSQGNRYRVEFLPENMKVTKEMLEGVHWKRVEGKIDDTRFVIKVPEELISSGSKLKIVDLKSGKSSLIDGSFLENVKNMAKNEVLTVQIDPDNPSDVKISSYERKYILPGGPVAR